MSEHPLFADHADREESGGSSCYINPEAIFDALRDEMAGNSATGRRPNFGLSSRSK